VWLKFTIASQVSELTLDYPVRVHLSGPPEDSAYVVSFEPKALRGVTVKAAAPILERIRSGEAVVFAFVHLKSTEKESRIASKRVTYFLAVWPDGAQQVEGTIETPDGAEEVPTVGITITAREGGG
jgi:hypothetical protein